MGIEIGVEGAGEEYKRNADERIRSVRKQWEPVTIEEEEREEGEAELHVKKMTNRASHASPTNLAGFTPPHLHIDTSNRYLYSRGISSLTPVELPAYRV